MLLISNVTCAALWLPLVIGSAVHPAAIPFDALVVEAPSLQEHLFLWIKACIVGVSWLRRAAVIVTFSVGTYLYREQHFWRKLPCVLGILAGILLILFS